MYLSGVCVREYTAFFWLITCAVIACHALWHFAFIEVCNSFARKTTMIFFENCYILWGRFISNALTVTCLTIKLLSHILCTSGPLYETFHKLWITRYNHMYLINFLGRYDNERWRGSCLVVGFVISSVWLLEFCYHRVSFSINIQCSVEWLWHATLHSRMCETFFIYVRSSTTKVMYTDGWEVQI